TELISLKLGNINGTDKKGIPVDQSFLTAASVCYDAVYVPDGEDSAKALANEPDAVHFLDQAFKHCKAIAFHADASKLLAATGFAGHVVKGKSTDKGLILAQDFGGLRDGFVAAIANHRVWEREKAGKIPA
ncbi:MAG: catalase HPII, partial [Bacteroidota bacterium]